MKKRIFALLLVLVMLLSCTLMLTSCPDDEPDPGEGELNLDEGLNEGAGSTDISVITDPNSPEAGKGTADKYIGD